MSKSNEKKAVLAMLILSVSYGISGFTARELQQHFGIWQQVAVQSWLGLFLSVLWQRFWAGGAARLVVENSAVWGLVGRAIIGRIVGSFFFIQACTYAPLGNVAWISALPTSALFGWLFFGQYISLREWSLLAVGVIGVGMIVGSASGHEMLGLGELYALLSALALGLASLLGRRAVQKQGAIVATSWVLFFSGSFATMAAYVFEGGLALPPLSLMPMLSLVTIMAVLGSACSLYGFTYLRASTATGLLSLEAIWGVALGMSIYGEVPTRQSLFGGALIVLAAYLVTRTQTARGDVRESSLVEAVDRVVLERECRGCAPRCIA